MLSLLIIVGIILTVVVWSNFGPLWGLIAGFLLVGGLGWKLLFGVLGAVRPGRKEKTEFVDAWEARVMKMEFGHPTTYPPRELYQQWLRDRKTTGESAESWIQRTMGSGAAGQLWTPGNPRDESPSPRMGHTVPLIEADEVVAGTTAPLASGLRFGNSLIPWSDVEKVVLTKPGMLIFHIRPGLYTDSPSGEPFPVHVIRVSDLGDAEMAWRDFIGRRGLPSS